MAVSRYRIDNFSGAGLGSNKAIRNIRDALRNNSLSYNTRVLREGQRLDIISFESYGDPRYWWVIAAASGIGWWLQVPPGTRLRIPNLEQILELL